MNKPSLASRFAALAALALLGAGSAWAQGTGGQPTEVTPAAANAVLPSIEMLAHQTTLAGTCGGAAFNVNTFIRVDSQASAQVLLSAPGIPTLETFTDETGANIGPFNGNFPAFNIPAFGGGLPPNTPIRIVINTYTGHALAGVVTYTSTMQFDCTTGTVLNLVAAAPGAPAPIPTLAEYGIGLTALLLGALALMRLRRPRPAPRARS
jgi:hypothetical protein